MVISIAITFLPTLCTLLRIALTPCIVMAMLSNHWLIAFSLFIIAGITDVADGFFARLFNCQSFLGACLDPLADKLLLISCFVTLSIFSTPLFSIPSWFVLLIVIKEFIILAGAAFLLQQRIVTIEPTSLSKRTTFMQLLFITWLFSCYFFQWVPIKTFNGILIILSLLIIICLLQYIVIGYKKFYAALLKRA